MLKLEGRIGGPWVDELGRAFGVVVGQDGAKTVKVDMRAVSYVDRRGAELLLEMESKGATVVNCSHFVRQLVQSDAVNKERARTKTKQTKKES